MIDTNMTVWLIEVNINPALHVNCDLLKEILPPLVEESLREFNNDATSVFFRISSTTGFFLPTILRLIFCHTAAFDHLVGAWTL